MAAWATYVGKCDGEANSREREGEEGEIESSPRFGGVAAKANPRLFPALPRPVWTGSDASQSKKQQQETEPSLRQTDETGEMTQGQRERNSLHPLHSSIAGCAYVPSLCLEDEECASDGLFGRCSSRWAWSEAGAAVSVRESLSLSELGALRSELERLVTAGRSWGSARVQCALAYFFLAQRHQLPYQTDFCAVRSPLNVLAVVQLVEEGLDQAEAEAVVAALEEGALEEEAAEEEEAAPAYYELVEEPQVQEKRAPPSDYYYDEEAAASAAAAAEAERETVLGNLVQELIADVGRPEEYGEYETPADYVEGESSGLPAGVLGDEDQGVLNSLLLAVLRGEQPDLSGLSDEQLSNFILNIQLMQDILRAKTAEKEEGQWEEAEPEAEGAADEERLVLKKDSEQLGDLDTGLPRDHHIVKGKGGDAPPDHHLQRIQGNTVYIRLNRDMEEDEGKLLGLVSFLEEKIARPKNLTFSNFRSVPSLSTSHRRTQTILLFAGWRTTRCPSKSREPTQARKRRRRPGSPMFSTIFPKLAVQARK